MATSKQEHLYNEIVEYYNFADQLIEIVENSKDDLSESQAEIVENIVENLEKYADQLSSQFVEFVKNGTSQEIVEGMKTSIQKISAQIEECRNQIFRIYSQYN